VTRTLQEALANIVNSYRSGARLLFLFDYDGTLVPIAPRPDMAVMTAVTRRRLERLIQLPSVFVAVLSGRTLADLKAKVGISGLYYAGTSGLELDLCGATLIHPESDRAARLIAVVADRVNRDVAGYSGAWVEHKRLGLTVHYRQVEADRIDALRRRVIQSAEPFSGALQVLDGPMAIEMVPNLGWTKSSALFKIIETIQRGCEGAVIPFCAGDAGNDADVLRATDALGGIAIGIGERAPATARHRLLSPAELDACLDALLERLAATSPPACLSSADPATA
jgi:trehalose-phosphatase